MYILKQNYPYQYQVMNCRKIKTQLGLLCKILITSGKEQDKNE